MSWIILGLTSPKQGGKDMVADIIKREFSDTPYEVFYRRFADTLKDMVAELFGWDRDRLDDDVQYKEMPQKEWNYLTPRRALQLIGTEMFRDGPLRQLYGINIWVDLLKRRLREDLSSPFGSGLIIVPDCRFQNEFAMIKHLGGRMIFMDPTPRIQPEPDGHSSEWDMWNYTGYDHKIDTGHEMYKTEVEAKDLANLLLDELMEVQ